MRISLTSFRPPKLSDCCGAAALGRIGNLTTKLAAEIRLLPRHAPWSARAARPEACRRRSADDGSCPGRYVSQRLNELRHHSPVRRTVALDTDLLDNVTDGTLPLLIGVISAGVLLLLVGCGILPSLKIGEANFSASSLTWQLVLVIGFLGGFLERLVPDLLEKKNPQGDGSNQTIVAASPR